MIRYGYILLFLVRLAAGCTAATTSTAQTRDAAAVVKISNTRFTRDSGSEVIAAGTVANHAREPVHNVVLTARVYDAAGRLLGEGVVALADPLPPRRSRPFSVPVRNLGRGQHAALTVSVTRADFIREE